jgi:hypothetical protein
MKVPWMAPGNGGPDQVWDFSRMSTGGETMVSTIPPVPSNPEKSSGDFNIILNERGSEYFFRLTEESFIETGGVTKDYNLTFNDPMIKMMYPFSYGNHFTDNYDGMASAQTGQKVEFSGVYAVTADAFGTLVLPGKVYTDVLRVKTESNGLEINTCNSVEAKTVRYLWYAPGYRYPVLNIATTERRVSGREAEVTKSAMVWAGKNSDTPAGSEKPQDPTLNEEVTVVAYPNPFTDKLNYHYFLRKAVPASIILTDVTGRTSYQVMKKMMQEEGLHSGTLESGDLNLDPGVYYLRFVFDRQVVVRKIVKL